MKTGQLVEYRGMIGTILEPSSIGWGHYNVDFTASGGLIDRVYGVDLTPCASKTPTKTEASRRLFSRGDRVRVTGKHSKAWKGVTGTVLHHGDIGHFVKVKLDKYDLTTNFSSKHLELITEEEKPMARIFDGSDVRIIVSLVLSSKGLAVTDEAVDQAIETLRAKKEAEARKRRTFRIEIELNADPVPSRQTAAESLCRRIANDWPSVMDARVIPMAVDVVENPNLCSMEPER